MWNAANNIGIELHSVNSEFSFHALLIDARHEPAGCTNNIHLRWRCGCARVPPGFEAAGLIVDIRMPNMSGLELQARPKKEERHIPIIFIIAFEDEVSQTQAIRDRTVYSL